MQSLYLATIFAATIVCFLTSLLIFSRRKSGERSRVILACIVLFSVGNYVTRFIALCQGEVPTLIVSVPILLLALFMEICYIMYPIEVISPGYLNLGRIVKLFSPCLVLAGIYGLCLQVGVTFRPYHSLLDMLPHVTEFQVWFRLLLSLLIFTPVLLIFTIPYTRRYNNADRAWTLKYTLCLSINTLAFVTLLVTDSLVIKTLYYYVSVGCSLYIAYMELFVRLIERRREAIGEQEEEPSVVSVAEPNRIETSSARSNPLCDRIILHMDRTSDYRDPDISLNKLADSLYTNRTTLSNALHDLGYSSFSDYINTLRIEDFIQHVRNKEVSNYQDAFYDVGFRSRATALRNFKRYTGKTPSEYFTE